LREKIFQKLLLGKQPEPVQLAAVRVLAGREDFISMRMLVRRWNSFTPAVRAIVEDSFTHSSGRLAFLLQALEQGHLDRSSLSRNARTRLLEHGNTDARVKAARLLGSVSDEKREEVINAYYESTILAGDARKGESIFKSSCGSCHQRGEAGRHFGPDLLSVTNQTRINLLTMILNPNHTISPGYDGYIVETTDGKTVAGILASETATAVVLRTPENKEVMIAREHIRAVRPMITSLMPDGLEAGISVADMANLLEFLKTR
jgi:putative heme-binding domain-containing protein